MYAVTVTFDIAPDQMPKFLPLMQANAASSLKLEEGCLQFDICTDPDRPDQLFLYEVYSDEVAFKSHLASEHFKAFDAEVADMVVGKDIRLFREVLQ